MKAGWKNKNKLERECVNGGKVRIPKWDKAQCTTNCGTFIWEKCTINYGTSGIWIKVWNIWNKCCNTKSIVKSYNTNGELGQIIRQ